MSRRVDWDDPEIRGRLGQVPDSVLAAELGMTKSGVQYARKRLGIELTEAARAEGRRLMGEAPKPKRLGSRWEDPAVLRRLGKEPDADIARDLGVTGAAVLRARRQRGIELTDEARARGRTAHVVRLARADEVGEDGVPAVVDWSDPELQRRLGREPDAVIARDLGLSPGTVWEQRRRRGIELTDEARAEARRLAQAGRVRGGRTRRTNRPPENE